MDPAKLKVVELRAELNKRGLDTKGNKPVLVDRLRQALDEEKATGGSSESPTPLTQKTDEGSESEDEAPESSKPPPRTPSRSSRHTSREPATPAKTPTRRSSSRSSLSRQSPARSAAPEIHNEPALEPIVEEDKSSPKKDAAPAVSPQKGVASVDSSKKDDAPTPAPKKDSEPAATPKTVPPPTTPKQQTVITSPKKQEVQTTPKKEQKEIVENESPKKAELEIVKEAEKHVPDKAQEITRRSSDEIQKLQANAQSAAKAGAQSPVKAGAQSPVKSAVPVAQSPVKQAVTQSPVKQEPVAQSPVQQVTVQSPVKQAAQSPVEQAAKEKAQSPAKTPVKTSAQIPVKTAESPVKTSAQTPVKTVESPIEAQTPVKTAESPAKTTTQTPVKTAESPVKASPQKNEQTPTKETAESPNKKLKASAEPMQTDKVDVKDSKDKADGQSMEVDQENDAKPMETDGQPENEPEKKSEDRKRKRSPSPREEAPRAPPIARPENEPTFDEKSVLLSWYDSDLNLVINTLNFLSASPMQGDGFNFMWAGVRASHGFNKGKVYYEAKVTSEFDNVSAAAAASKGDNSGAIPADDEKIPSILRLGWSIMGTSLQLGEEKFSYGYDGSGKKSTDKEFTEYGKTFGKNDVIGCYADFETDGNVTVTYTLNGESQGPAFVIKKDELEGKALFPHLLGRNCSFSVNFGQEENWSQALEEYQLVGKVDENDKILGPRRPEKREDCEVILLCGLPLSGKTSWATKHVAENPEKMYSVLGTHSLIQRMTVDGAPLKEKFKGRWELVVEKCSRAVNKLLESAPSRRRNYILDQQANVYGSAQKRKMRNFYGFHRKAIIVLPTDDELKSRITKRKEESGGEEIRESSMLEVKANLCVPTVGESFEEVVWAELAEEEGKKLIETYISEGKSAGYGQSQQQQQQSNKRSRFDNGNKDRNNRDNRRPGFNDRRSGGPWRGGPGGGWRDNNRMRGSPMGGRYGSPGGGWRGRGGPPPRMGGDRNERRQGNERNRQSGRPGGWNAMGYQGGSGGWAGQGGWQGQGSWGGQSGGWGGGAQQAWGGSGGSWKGYGGQNNYGGGSSGGGGGSNNAAAGYGSSGYGNGANWNNWGGQYYSQYWGGSQQQQASGAGTGAAQGVTGQQTQSAQPAASQTSQAVSGTSTTAGASDGYDYSSWQDYSQSSYGYPATDSQSQQQQQQQ